MLPTREIEMLNIQSQSLSNPEYIDGTEARKRIEKAHGTERDKVADKDGGISVYSL